MISYDQSIIIRGRMNELNLKRSAEAIQGFEETMKGFSGGGYLVGFVLKKVLWLPVENGLKARPSRRRNSSNENRGCGP